MSSRASIFSATQHDYHRRELAVASTAAAAQDTAAKGVGSAFYRIDLGLSGESFPGLESANEIGGAFDAELAQRRGRRLELYLVADDDHAQVCAVCLGNVVRAGWVQPPLQDIAVDDQRPG